MAGQSVSYGKKVQTVKEIFNELCLANRKQIITQKKGTC